MRLTMKKERITNEPRPGYTEPGGVEEEMNEILEGGLSAEKREEEVQSQTTTPH